MTQLKDNVDGCAAITQWMKAVMSAAEWEAVKAGATTVMEGDHGMIHALWSRYRSSIIGPLGANRLSTHYLLPQILRPLHQYEINDLDVEGQAGHLLVGLTDRFDTFFQFERYSARMDRPGDFIRHCMAGVFSFFDGTNRGPGMRRTAAVVVLDWTRLHRL